MSAPFSSLAALAEVTCRAMLSARSDGQHELGDLIEADMADAVRTIWTAAGPMLRMSIASMIAETAR